MSRAATGGPAAVNRSTGAVTTSLTVITIPGTRDGTRPLTRIVTVAAELPAAEAVGPSRKPGAACLAKTTAAWTPRPGGGLAVLATSAPWRAAAIAVSRARYHMQAWTITRMAARKTGIITTSLSVSAPASVRSSPHTSGQLG